ncbi:pheromone autoinducer 2 transporter [mine drainage metagenome]|uniref:Pheromone autoinducer 2 transporter n=1 Tax=mine drainage metagenome TaxID=410659 RepID=A0A1J5QNC4_9ZZZZ
MPLSTANKIRLSWAAVGAAALGLLLLLAPVLMPFLVALTLGYALHPAVDRLHRWRVPRALGAALALALLCGALLAVGSLIVAVLQRTLPQLQQQVPVLLGRVGDWLGAHAAQLGWTGGFDLDALRQALARMLAGDPQRWAVQLLSSARSGGGVLLNWTANLVLIPVVTFYLLLDWDALMQRSFALVPLPRRDALRDLLLECDALLARYLRGQLLVMLVLAAYYSVGLALAGFQLALPIGVFTGLAVCVPFVGFGVGLLLALLAGALQFQSLYAIGAVAVIYGSGQVVESSWLTPKLLGHHIGLHPLLVIFLLLAFGSLFGFIGVLLALPAGALLLVLARHALAWYRRSALFLGS